MAEHIAPKKLYISVFIALLILTVLTTAVAYVDLHPWNTVVALAIAICKASLVAIFFMHLRWTAPMMRVIAVAAIFWLAIMLTLTLTDTLSRRWVDHAHPWQASSLVTSPTMAASRR